MRAGHVPTARVAPVIDRLIAERWPNGGLEVLAEKAGCDASTIEGIIAQENPGMAFDLADRLLCALGPGIRAWRGELEDVYYGVEFVETCALHSCSKTFRERFNGPTRKRYCSPRCATLANAVAQGRATGERLRQKGKCLKGHAMTPENTIVKWRERDQKYEHQCRECKRTTQREWLRKKRANPEFRALAVERTRRWREKAAA